MQLRNHARACRGSVRVLWMFLGLLFFNLPLPALAGPPVTFELLEGGIRAESYCTAASCTLGQNVQLCTTTNCQLSIPFGTFHPLGDMHNGDALVQISTTDRRADIHVEGSALTAFTTPQEAPPAANISFSATGRIYVFTDVPTGTPVTVTLTAVSERLGDHALTIESFRAGSIGLGTFSTTYVVIANGGRWLVDSISVSGEAGYGANDGQPHSLAFKASVSIDVRLPGDPGGDPG